MDEKIKEWEERLNVCCSTAIEVSLRFLAEELLSRIKELEEGIESLPRNQTEKIQEIMRKHGFVIDNLEDRWQKFAFTLYNEIVEAQSKIEELYKLIEK